MKKSLLLWVALMASTSALAAEQKGNSLRRRSDFCAV
jgi:hypothetical protein